MKSVDPTQAPPIASATVIMLRDAPGGLEVFLVKRHGLSDVLGGAYVFPGGKVDAADRELADTLDRPASVLHEALGEPELAEVEAAALYVAAIREVFEEAGVRYAETASLVPWSRWITPVASIRMRKRFDARFFVAAVPPGQEPVHDEHEATESVWLPPRTALQQYWDKQIDLAPPQILSLAHLSRHADVASVLAEARGRRPPAIQPEALEQDGMRLICLPGDELHPVRSPVVPGPTRLCWRNDRHEPVAGFDSLFD